MHRNIFTSRLAATCLRTSHRSVPRRTFFSIPDLPSLSPFSSNEGEREPQKYHERKIFPYKQKDLYDLVADVDSYHHFIPFCTASRVLSSIPAPDGLSTKLEAELQVGFLGFEESYVSQVLCRPHEMVQATAASSTPLFKTLVTTWRFQPASPSSPHPTSSPPLRRSPADTDSAEPTLVTIDLVYDFASPIHAKVSSAFFGRVSSMMVRAFEERCLQVYGPGTR